jgi:tetratricopeptide (TPR) repeat protein
MTGIGNVHMQITATPEAQMWFNQGLNLLDDFWDYESARAFEQSVRVDPQCAICYWGLYKALSFYHGTEQGYAPHALAKAVSLKSHAGKRERLYIEAAAAIANERKHRRPGEGLSKGVDLWREIVKEYPKDTEARVCLWWLIGHKEGAALMESILKRDPDNSAANHLYIHSMEGTGHPEKALHSAEILTSLAPSSGHMVHMPGHIFFRLGDYARAESAFAASMQADERYMREQHVSPDLDWNYVHNLMYAVANLLEEGKIKEANTLSLKIPAARGELEPTYYIYMARDSITRVNPCLPVALRTADWTQALKLLQAGKPLAGKPHLAFLARQLTRFATGMQAVQMHHLHQAESASLHFDAALWRASRQLQAIRRKQSAKKKPAAPENPPRIEIKPDALLWPLLRNLSVHSLELRASLRAAQGKIAQAKELFARAGQAEKALGYHEPPIYIRPAGAAEGAAMLAAGDWADAKAGYQQALHERPKSGFALYGLALTSEKAGDAKVAAKEYTEFLNAWKNADSTLPQLKHARAYLAEQ